MEEICYASRIQADIRFRTGLWGVWLCSENRYIAHGPQGKMQQLVKLLSDPSVECRITQKSEDK